MLNEVNSVVVVYSTIVLANCLSGLEFQDSEEVRLAWNTVSFNRWELRYTSQHPDLAQRVLDSFNYNPAQLKGRYKLQI